MSSTPYTLSGIYKDQLCTIAWGYENRDSRTAVITSVGFSPDIAELYAEFGISEIERWFHSALETVINNIEACTDAKWVHIHIGNNTYELGNQVKALVNCGFVISRIEHNIVVFDLTLHQEA